MKTYRTFVSEAKHDLDAGPSHEIGQEFDALASEHHVEARKHQRGSVDHHRHMLVALTAKGSAHVARWEHRTADSYKDRIGFHSDVLDYLGDKTFHYRSSPHWEKFNSINRKYR